MRKKNRFSYRYYDDGTESIYDKKEDEYYFHHEIEEICKLLNNFAEENEKLKKEKIEIKDILEDNRRLKFDIERFQEIMGLFDISSFDELISILEQGCGV